MLVPFTDMLAAAQHDGYAVMAPDFATLHMARSLLEAAEAHRAPLLLSFAPSLGAARDLPDTHRFLVAARELAAGSSARVGLHLDHATTLEQIRQGIEAGFTSVMIDASREPWEVNVERTRQAVEMAHAAGVHVEAELGHVAIGDRYMAQGSADDNTTVYTDPDRAAEFVALTGVDALAVSVGTIHGSYVGEPQLQFDLLARLHAEVPVPLVLHGASGTGAANIRRAVSLGISKINLFSEVMAAIKAEIAALIVQPTSGPIELAEAQARGIERVLAEWFAISGSAGQAAAPAPPAPRALDAIRGWVLDMDGTIFLGDELLPGAEAFLNLLAGRGLPTLLMTNNSSKHRAQYAEKLAALGLNVPEEMIFTSGEAAALTLKGQRPGARVYLVGTPALEAEFEGHGFTLTDDSPDVVVLGFDTTLTYDKLWKLCDFVRAGLPYIATHPDVNCPLPDGFMPDIGATIAFVEASTGRLPDQIVGKPNRPVVEAVAQRTGLPVESLAMVGDRLYTDIALGEAGMTTVLVLTGETQPDDIPTAATPPDYVMRDLQALHDALRASGETG